MSAARSTVLFLLGWCALMCAMLPAGGCQVIGAGAYVLTGPPSVPAQYVPVKEPMLILVENYSNPSLHQMEADQLTHCICTDLKANEVAPLIEMEKLREVRDKMGERMRRMTIPQIGQAVGAKQVLYVNIRRADVQELSGGSCSGKMDLRVRLVDVAGGTTRWPKDAEDGHPVTVETPVVMQGESAAADALKSQMIQDAGQQIARLFYEWKPE